MRREKERCRQDGSEKQTTTCACCYELVSIDTPTLGLRFARATLALSIQAQTLLHTHTLTYTLSPSRRSPTSTHAHSLSLSLTLTWQLRAWISRIQKSHGSAPRSATRERERDSQKTMISISLGRQRQQIQWRRGRNTLRRKCRGDKTTPLAIY